jgi:ribonuclease BN (tRNA processing enzyme)
MDRGSHQILYQMNLNVLQAAYGDCMILKSGSQSKSSQTNSYHFLIDGGPASTYNACLKGELQKIRENGGRVDLLIVSHVDNDHINGLLKLMRDLSLQKTSTKRWTIEIDALWYNAFSRTIGQHIERRLRNLLRNTRTVFKTRSRAQMTVRGIREGHDLYQYAHDLAIEINPQFNNDTIVVNDKPKELKFGDIRFLVIGPTRKNLEDLRKQWLDWLDKHEKALKTRADYRLAIQADKSIPNLSSIMFLAKEDDNTILFTGDGLSEHVIYGLKQSKLLGSSRSVHVNILKLPHHGSDRNVTRDFFTNVTADKYLISANGRDDNPSFLTLSWIAETAKEQHRQVEIILTNNTPNVERFVKKYPKDEYGYKLKLMKKGSHSMNLRLE